MNDSTDKCGTSALVTNDWLVRCEGGPRANVSEAAQQPIPAFHFSMEQIMKRFFQFLKRQDVALAITLVWMVVWAGGAMTEAFNHIA